VVQNADDRDDSRKVNPLQAELSHRLLSLFLSQGMTAGEHLAERELAEQCQVSRSPIRAALKLLEHHGVVQQRPKGGYQLAKEGSALAQIELELPQAPLDALYVQLGQDRVLGVLDEHVMEADLLRRYDVPRALLNRVLTQMASEGLLQPAQGKGWHFTALINSEESNRASYELRRVIEPAALRLEGFRVDSGRLKSCLALHRELVDGLLFEIEGHKLLTINANFHQMLVDFSGNPFFIDIMRQQNRMRRFTESGATLYPERMLMSCQEHLDIMEALTQGDHDWAARLMERHLSVAGKGNLGVPQPE